MHFYEAMNDGAIVPRHFVSMTSRPDELRPTRISDVRKWWKEGRNVAPSVTTVINCLAKPALADWKVGQHLETAWRHKSVTHLWEMNLEDFQAEIKFLTEIEMDKAPSAGTDIHKELEAWFDGRPVSDSAHGICMNVGTSIVTYTGDAGWGWDTERNFVHPLGFGGQVDLSGNGWVIDFKSKQTADKFKPGKMAYDDHRIQLAAYREGLGMPKARAANCFVCLENGEVDFHEHTEADLDKGWKLFQHALAIWQLQSGAMT